MRLFYQHSTPSEFWSICPVEAQAFIEARSRNRLIMAWQTASMTALAKTKHFPKDPKDLFGEKAKPMSFDSMLAFAKAKLGGYEKKHDANPDR